MALKQRLTADITQALRAGRREEVASLRYIASLLKQREVDERRSLDDADVIAILGKLLKQHEEAIEQFRRAGRDDLVHREEEEILLVRRYLPTPLTETEIDALIDETIATLSRTSTPRMGEVMNALRTRLAGRADMRVVSARVKARLEN